MISFLICMIFLIIVYVRGYNIDLNHAVIFTDEFNDYSRSSYFGYSVILYSNDNDNQTWVQIGSPRGNMSGHNNIREPGVVYRCNIFGPCTPIDVETFGNLESYQEDNSSTELFGGAWLGGAMDINPQSGRIVICGHRWRNHENKLSEYYMEGVCYWSRVNETIYRKLIPLKSEVFRNKYIGNDVYKATSKYDYFYYAQGQAGICTHFSNSHEQQELLLGAPGVFNWEGTTIIYRDVVNNLPPTSRLLQNNPNGGRNPSTALDYFSKLNIANAIRTRQTVPFDLFGYSATSGYFFKTDELLYASAAPRSRYTGKVLIFNFSNISDRALEIISSVEGQQVGEYFGAFLTAGDINNDGLDDLIVGAPYYSGTTYNQGRIYMFLGTLEGRFETPQLNPIIVGESPGGQFGASLMFLNNFSNDGFASVAVGAPYENNNTGVVYIYRGSENGLQTVPSQKILGSSFSPSIKGFGISISKPTDIDRNFYNDLAIGAYISKHVVILRSKPVITIQQSLIPLIPNLDSTSTDFQIRSCFWYTGYKAPPTINITRKILVDDLFLRADLDPSIKQIKNITLTYDNPFCHNITVFIKPDITNRDDPMRVTVTPELILSSHEKRFIYTTHHEDQTKLDTFCKDCPISNPYLSTKGQIIDFAFALGCGEDNICRTTMNLESKFINTQEGVYLLGSTDDLSFEITIHNLDENAYQAQAIVELPNSVYFRRIPNFCSDQNSSTVICSIGNPLGKNETRVVTLVLDMSKVDTIKYGDVLCFNITQQTSSVNLNRKRFKKCLTISREADIAVTGASSEQSYLVDNSTNSTPHCTHIYQIEKYGASPVEEVVLTILVPSRILLSKWTRFTEFDQTIYDNQAVSCRIDDPHLSLEDNLHENTKFKSDIVKDTKNMNTDDLVTVKKRSVDNVMQNTEEENVILQNSESLGEFGYARNRVFNISCSSDDIICSKITCNIGPLSTKQNAAKIQLTMILNVGVLSVLLGKKDIIVLSTEGSIVITSPRNFEQTGSREDTVRISSVFILEIPETTIESWIIIVSVIGALLLLCLIIFALSKAGFFQRKTNHELKALKELDAIEQSSEDTANCGEDKFNEVMNVPESELESEAESEGEMIKIELEN